MVRGLDLVAYKDKLREQGVFSLKNKKLREYIIAVKGSLMGRYREGRGQKGTVEEYETMDTTWNMGNSDLIRKKSIHYEHSKTVD